MLYVILILFASSFVVGGIWSKKKAKTIDAGSYTKRYYRTFGTAGIVTGLVLGAIITLTNTIVTLDAGNAKLVKSFTGQISEQTLYLENGGWAFKDPMSSTVEYDIRNRVLKFEGDGKDVAGPEVSSVDKNGARATFPVTIDYSIPHSKLAEIYRDYGDQSSFEEKVMKVKIRNFAELTPRNYETAVFRNQQADAQMTLKETLQNDAKLTSYGITINSAFIGTPKYPANIEDSLGKIQEARNLADKAKADLETAKIEAEKTRVEGGAQADYDQIVRCGATTTSEEVVINNEKTTITKVIPNVGKACQNRLNNQVLLKNYIDALKEMADKGNLIVVPEGFGGILNVPNAKK